MDQRVSLVTLGVTDLDRSRLFYEQLGWSGQQVEETVFFQAGGLGIVLWAREKLAADAGVDAGRADVFGGIVLAHNVRSRDEVNSIMDAAVRAGATATRPPSVTFYGGYAGAFVDPDGHVWEIAHNPSFPLDEHGAITIPDLGGPDRTEAPDNTEAPDRTGP